MGLIMFPAPIFVQYPLSTRHVSILMNVGSRARERATSAGLRPSSVEARTRRAVVSYLKLSGHFFTSLFRCCETRRDFFELRGGKYAVRSGAHTI